MSITTETILFKILGDAKGGSAAIDKIKTKLLGLGSTITAVSDAALVTFAKLGESGAKLDVLEGKFERMANALGRSSQEMLSSWTEASAGVIDQAELMAKANYLTLTGIPVDELDWMLAAVRNASEATGISMDQLFTKLSYGLARQSKLMLDDLGIVFNASEAYEEYAHSIGKATDELTSHERMLAFASKARAAAARQADILGEATENASTRIQRARAEFTNIKNTISKAFIPVALFAANVVIMIAEVFDKIPQPVLDLIAKLLTLVAALGAVVGPMMILVAVLPAIQGAFMTVMQVLAPFIALGLAAAAVGALIAKAWTENWGGIQETVRFVIDTIRPYIETIVYQVQYWMRRIRIQIEGIVQAIRALVEPALLRLRKLLDEGAGLKEFMILMRDATGAILSFVEGLLSAIRLLLEGKADQAWAPLEDAALNVITVIVLTWRKYISKALVWGWNLVVNLANGIIRAAKSVLTEAASFVGRILSGFWEAHSPPKKGPLSGIVDWGKGLMNTYLRSFALADFGILNDIMDPVREALTAAVGLGDLEEEDSLTIFRSVREQVAGLLADFRATGEISQEIMGGISEALGAGGEDYVEYLRLTLEHQKALQNLAAIEDEVAAAEARGFVPADLKARLAAAQEEADAKEEAVDWQREYLAALQEGVDIQVQMLQAMQDLTEAMSSSGGGGGIISVDPTGSIALPDAGEEASFSGFGGFSEEFEKVKEEVRKWFADLPANLLAWLKTAWIQVQVWFVLARYDVTAWLLETWTAIQLWFAEKAGSVSSWLVGIWLSVHDWFAQIKLDVLDWFGDIWNAVGDWIEGTGPEDVGRWLGVVSIAIFDWFALAWAKINLWMLLLTLSLAKWFVDLGPKLRGWMAAIGVILGNWVKVKWQQWMTMSTALYLLVRTLFKVVWGIVWTWMKTIGAEIYSRLKDTYDDLVAQVTAAKDWLEEKMTEIAKAIGGFASDFYDKGSDVIQGFWNGIKAKWEEVKQWFQGALGDLPQWATDILGIHSPSKVFRWIGEMSVAGFEQGLQGLTGLQSSLKSSLYPNVAGGLAGAGSQVFVVQIPALSLPGIKDGRDSESLIEQILQQSVDKANLRGLVPGGVM